MKFWSVLRTALFALASLGYLANGAQAHVNVSAGETLNLMMCGSGAVKPNASAALSDAARFRDI